MDIQFAKYKELIEQQLKELTAGKIRLRGRSWLAERRGRSGQGNGLDRPFNCIFGLLKIHWRDRKRWVKLAG